MMLEFTLKIIVVLFFVLGELMDDIGRHQILIRMATSPYHEKSGPGESPVVMVTSILTPDNRY